MDWSGIITIFFAFLLFVVYDHLRKYVVRKFKNTKYDNFIKDVFIEYYYYLDYITHNETTPQMKKLLTANPPKIWRTGFAYLSELNLIGEIRKIRIISGLKYTHKIDDTFDRKRDRYRRQKYEKDSCNCNWNIVNHIPFTLVGDG